MSKLIIGLALAQIFVAQSLFAATTTVIERDNLYKFALSPTIIDPSDGRVYITCNGLSNYSQMNNEQTLLKANFSEDSQFVRYHYIIDNSDLNIQVDNEILIEELETNDKRETASVVARVVTISKKDGSALYPSTIYSPKKDTLHMICIKRSFGK